jgi:hypothetical protein
MTYEPSTPEAIDAYRQELAGNTPRMLPKLPPHRTARAVDEASLRRLTDRPDWQRHNAPAEVAERWQTIVDTAGQVREALRSVRSLEADQRAEAAKVEAAVRDMLAEGRTPKAGKATDWAAEALTRETVLNVLSEELRSARRAYEAAVAESLLDWRNSYADRLPELKHAAEEAMAPAAEAFRAWRAAVAAAEDLERVRDNERVADNTQTVPPSIRALLDSGTVDDAQALLTSDPPVITGSWLTDVDELSPARHVREAMASNPNTASYIAHVEHEERYAHTDFTRDAWEQLMPPVDDAPTGGGWGYAV